MGTRTLAKTVDVDLDVIVLGDRGDRQRKGEVRGDAVSDVGLGADSAQGGRKGSRDGGIQLIDVDGVGAEDSGIDVANAVRTGIPLTVRAANHRITLNVQSFLNKEEQLVAVEVEKLRGDVGRVDVVDVPCIGLGDSGDSKQVGVEDIGNEGDLLGPLVDRVVGGTRQQQAVLVDLELVLVGRSRGLQKGHRAVCKRPGGPSGSADVFHIGIRHVNSPARFLSSTWCTTH